MSNVPQSGTQRLPRHNGLGNAVPLLPPFPWLGLGRATGLLDLEL